MGNKAGLLIVLLSLLSLPILGQQSHKSGKLPEGWKMRFDYSSASLNNVIFNITDNNHYHFEVGPKEAAIYYKPEMKTSGSYSLQATFTQLQETSHPEAYGLFVGGKNLQDADQGYLYFLVRQDGKYLIKQRSGPDTKTITDWTSNEAVNALRGRQQVTNKLEIACGHRHIKFVVNGEVVETILRSKLKNVEGIAGLRINHHLHLDVKDFDFDPMEQNFRIFIF